MKTKDLFCFVLTGGLLAAVAGSASARPFEFHTRSRQLRPGTTNQFEVVEKVVEWDPKKTAIIICDMWNQHWCKGATARVAEMAPRMNEVLKNARERGVFIIHSPSDTMKFYTSWPQRLRAQQAPHATPPSDVSKWAALNRVKEPPLPIDDSDGGCDDVPQCPQGSPWRHEISTLEIAPEDAISDDGQEVYNLLQENGRDNVILMGVHENMCVLGRPFSIRQMVSVGKHVVLMRDLTDTMYNSRRPPYVNHFVGTELVAEHIEKYWCPSITSADLLGGAPFHFKADHRPHVVFVLGEPEYQTAETWPAFAEQELGWRGFTFDFVNAPSSGGNEFTNWPAIANADVLCVSVRRRTPPSGMIEAIRAHLAAGKSLVAIRTASHSFAAKPPDAEHAAWEHFDQEVLGGHYENHYANELLPRIRVAAGAQGSPLLAGVPADGFAAHHSLYRSRDLAPTTQVLLTGTITVDGQPVTEPVAWINTNANRRVFYTSLGGPGDFQEPGFRRVLLNGMLWAADRPIPPTASAPSRPASASADAASGAYQKAWQPLRVPGTWEENSQGALADYDGLAWYRCIVHVPESWQGKPVQLWIERVDNAQETYVNGIKVGEAGALPPAYRNGDTVAALYKVPAGVLRFGANNVIAVRVYDAGGHGGFKGDAPALLTQDEAIKLEGSWQFRTGDDLAWSKPDPQLASAKADFNQVIDAAGISARTYTQRMQEQPMTPAESQARFNVADGLEIQQVLAEPIVRQPVSMTFDERGRLWVVQYLQYPDPAGLKMMSRDNVWRAVYDKVPPPPPHQFRGADKITIHEDTDGDGIFDKHKTFVDGLNIVTSIARGRGGVWVMNPPYLLFYPDANNDDVPDGDPEVRLSGFGLEDTHSVANSLHWGPDGWLYGCQGSTVTGNIIVYGANGQPLNKTPIFSQGQNIWRYQPEERRYEIFSEGGGNAFGMEIDSAGRIFSGHNGGDTRGFYYMQGAYEQKGFEKHGPLSNPYAFGYFPPMANNPVQRFTHNFIIYDSGALPAEYEGKLFGIEPLQGRVVMSDIEPDRSTFRTHDIRFPVTTSDQWFKPVDIKLGPDGAIYIADWYDRQVNHYRNHEGQIDKSNGRIYRLKAKGAMPIRTFNLTERTDAELVELLDSPNKWFRQEALRLLADRKHAALAPKLREMVSASQGRTALEALWALQVSAGLSDSDAQRFLHHDEPSVRTWTVRLIGDRDTQAVPAELAEEMATVAKSEPNVEVRAQLACTAKRLPASSGLPIVHNLLLHDEDAGDPRLPLLIWWAIESKAESDVEAVLGLFQERNLWSRPMVQNQILERLMRRYAMAGTRKDLLVCAKLLELAPAREQSAKLMAGFELAFKGRSLGGLPDQLLEAIAKSGGESLPLALRQGRPEAVKKALAIVGSPDSPASERLEFVRLFGEVNAPECVPVLLKLLRSLPDSNLAKAALASLQIYDQSQIGETVAQLEPSLPGDARTSAFELLVSRPKWALALLQAIDRGRIAKGEVPQDASLRMKLYAEPEIAGLFQSSFGHERVPTTAEMRQTIYRLAGVIQGGSGSPYEGQKVFNMTCGVCHTLFGQGGKVGPDLTVYKRDDLDNLLLNVVNPSAEIREGYENYLVTTRDGRTLSGFLADKDGQVVVLRGIDGQNTIVPQNQIVEMKSTGVSLMPQGLLDALDAQQVRDLFAYLRSTQPLVR